MGEPAGEPSEADKLVVVHYATKKEEGSKESLEERLVRLEKTVEEKLRAINFWSRFLIDVDDEALDFLLDPEEMERTELLNPQVLAVPMKYKPKERDDVGYWLAYIARVARNPKMVIETARTLSNYRGYEAAEIASNLAITAKGTVMAQSLLKWESLTAGTHADIEAARYKEMKQRLLDDYLNKCEFFSSKQVINLISSERTRNGRIVAAQLANDIFHKFKNPEQKEEAIFTIENIGARRAVLVPQKYLFGAIRRGWAPKITDDKSLLVTAAVVKFLGNTHRKAVTSTDLFSLLRERYGLQESITFGQLRMLLHVRKTDEVAKLIATSAKSMEAEYPIATKTLRERKEMFNEYVRHAVTAVVGSKDKAREVNSVVVISGIVGSSLLDRARNEFRTEYRSILPKILEQLPDYREAAHVLAKAVDHAELKRREVNETKEGKKKRRSSISEVFNRLDFLTNKVYVTGLHGLVACETKNPLHFNNDIQKCCAYLPYRDNIVKYSSNDKCILVRYEALALNQKPLELGSAICYFDRGRFLVDSVEGADAFIDPDIFSAVFEDLKTRAAVHGAEVVLFGKNGANKVPKAFVSYLRSQGLPEERVDMALPKKRSELYLETKANSLVFALRLSGERKALQTAIVPALRPSQQKVYNSG